MDLLSELLRLQMGVDWHTKEIFPWGMKQRWRPVCRGALRENQQTADRFHPSPEEAPIV